MHPALWISVTGIEAQNTDIRVISNNLANVSTTGYKRSRASFEDLLYQNVRQAGGQSSESTEVPTGLMLGTGVKTVGTQKVFSQGNIIQSQSELDMAVSGRGFFQVLRPEGDVAYTRDGQFTVNANGEMVNQNGYALQPSITIPANTTKVTIGSDGTITATIQGQTTPSQIGSLQISDFINPAGLEPIGENQFIETAASGSPTTAAPGSSGLGTILQGALESSNVNVVEELVRLIETQRAYEMNAKSVETVDGMLRYISQTL